MYISFALCRLSTQDPRDDMSLCGEFLLWSASIWFEFDSSCIFAMLSQRAAPHWIAKGNLAAHNNVYYKSHDRIVTDRYGCHIIPIYIYIYISATLSEEGGGGEEDTEDEGGQSACELSVRSSNKLYHFDDLSESIYLTIESVNPSHALGRRFL